MNIKVTYPELSQRRATRKRLIKIMRLPFAVAAIASPIVNLAVGGVAWSVIVLFGLYMVWNLAVAIDMIEYNRTSQFIKLIVYSIIMLILIDLLLTPESSWGELVIPIVAFSGLLAAAALFFTDFERQRHNLMPLLIIDVICLIASAIAIPLIAAMPEKVIWPYIVMGGVSLTLLIAFILTLKGGFIAELKRRFHARIT